MLQEQTLKASTLELLKTLMADKELNGFYLVGGTALALQIGHRISIDLDLFTDTNFDNAQLREHLENNYNFRTDYIANNTLKGEISGVKIDCIAHKYKWIDTFTDNGIRLAGLKDICAMKLNSIAGNGTRIKDFIDLAFLTEHYSLRQMLGFFEEKYNANPVMILKAITFFDEINYDEPVKMCNVKKLNWKKIEKRLQESAKYIDKKFSEPPL
ncbi:MAG: nucleotidyl transferase AbiEii/AbiGii toxin family protein [Bacteroidales bacterium]|nr:nucleotidyl transferase AbiEii/AbiGii toxin family protein [Bacteroidales bacterium]